MTATMLISLLTILLYVLTLSGLICTLLGAFILIQFMRPLDKPADASNRINRIRLVWFSLTRPELFVNEFQWLQNDELDNVKNHDRKG